MADVVIDGVKYVPAGDGDSRIGIAIKTHNRPQTLATALENHMKHLPEGAHVVVVDDGSTPKAEVPEGVVLRRHETSQGIVAAGNRSLELLMDAGCEHLFLWDDDAWPISDGWEKPYIASPEPHLAYQFLDLSGPNKIRDLSVLYEDEEHVAYSGQRGLMLYYHRSAIEQVGGFDPIYGRGMYEHSDLANRIHHAGLTTWRYADVAGSSKLVYSLDEHEAVERSVARADREALVKQNAVIHNQRMDQGEYPPYVEFRERRNVVLTCLYGKIADPQRKGERMSVEQLEPLISSVKGAKVVVHTDMGDVSNAETIHCELHGVNVFAKRWQDAYQYLRANLDIEWAVVCDGTDVQMLHEPWGHLQYGKLYVGCEPSIVDNAWLKTNHPDPQVQSFITENPGEQLLNAGVVLGDRATVMRFCHTMARHYFDRQRNRFYRRDTAGEDLGDMGAFQIVARQFDLVHGPRVTTVFRQNETNGWSWFRHK